jgi:hypothetical protein
MTIKERIAEINPEALFADGYEDALIGYVDRACQSTVALYDYEKCIGVLMTRDGMTRDEAVEFYEFNTACAYVGEHTPAFATILKPI